MNEKLRSAFTEKKSLRRKALQSNAKQNASLLTLDSSLFSQGEK